MEKKLREFRILNRKRTKSFPDVESMYCVRLGPLEKTQSKSFDKEEKLKEEDVLTEDLDSATADMLAMFGSVKLNSESSSARSSIMSKYSIQTETETDSDDDELDADQFEEEISPYFPGNRRFSMFVGQNIESRYNLSFLLTRLTHHKTVATKANAMNDRLSTRNPAGRILGQFRGSLNQALELATGMQDDDPVKMELLLTLQHHLFLLKEEVKENMKLTLLSSVIAEDLEEKSEYEADVQKIEI